MRFRSELLQPPSESSKVMLTRIYDVYMTREGRIEGEAESIAEVLESSDGGIGKDFCPKNV